MKKILRLIYILIVPIAMLLTVKSEAFADDLDRIHSYEIEVDSRTDGSLDISYHIEWEVLDSQSEGPLTWIKFGIPNQDVEEVTALSENIKKIRYMEDSGDYVRIDLDRAYHAGEVLDIDFSIHQHSMFKTKTNNYEFSFTPGWFPEIKIDEMIIRWNAKPGTESTAVAVNGYYEKTKTDLRRGERLGIVVKYDKSLYHFKGKFEENTQKKNEKLAGLFLFVVLCGGGFIGAFIILIVRRNKLPLDGYNTHSGMGSHYYVNHTSGTRGGRGGGCACACACACAGGGRAGCSIKEIGVTNHRKTTIHRNQDGVYFFTSDQN